MTFIAIAAAFALGYLVGFRRGFNSIADDAIAALSAAGVALDNGRAYLYGALPSLPPSDEVRAEDERRAA